MIIYKCIITGDEMFSDVYKITDNNGIIFEVEGKLTSRTEQIDESLLGANASADEPSETCDSSTVRGVDIVLNHKLVKIEGEFKKDAYKAYIKDYMKAIKKKLSETKPDRVQPFMSGAKEEVTKILNNYKNYEFFMGETMNLEGAIGLLDYRPDGSTPYMVFFKDGLEMEKC